MIFLQAAVFGFGYGYVGGKLIITIFAYGLFSAWLLVAALDFRRSRVFQEMHAKNVATVKSPLRTVAGRLFPSGFV